MAQVSLNTGELKEFVKQIMNNNRHIQAKGLTPVAINVEGEHGLGKTTVISQIAKEEGLDFVKINVSQLDELSDLVGFPVKEFQVSKLVDGIAKTKWVTEMEAERAIKDPSVKLTGLKRTTYCPPEWIAGKKNGGILLLDDYTRGSQIMIQACMDLIYTQEYYSWKLPQDWHIVLK
jgi:MoxR-like ATPase